MKKLRDIIPGERFGRWTAIEPSTIMLGKSKAWLCRCECGTERLVTIYRLLYGTSLSCGCLKIDKNKQRRQDLTGQRFTRLTALSPDGPSTWLCRCDCGKFCSIGTNQLTKGYVKSCGCYNRDRAKNEMTKYFPLCLEKISEQQYDGTMICAIRLGRKALKNSKTGIRGVTQIPNGKYRAEIKLRGKRYHLGVFFTKEDAAEARRLAEERLYAPVIEAFEAKKMNQPEKERDAVQ